MGNWRSVLLNRLWLPVFFLVIMWASEVIEWAMGISFSSLGILPRDPAHLYGVLTAPLLHSNWEHILSNSLPFFVLSAILFLAYRRISYTVFLLIYLLTGLAVWALARGGSYHIGASGMVYGLFGFVFFSGLFRGDMRSIGLALIVGFFYGGMVWGVLPNQPGISWESHFFGGMAGGVLAWYYRNVGKTPAPKWMEEPEPRKNFEDFIQRYEQRNR